MLTAPHDPSVVAGPVGVDTGPVTLPEMVARVDEDADADGDASADADADGEALGCAPHFPKPAWQPVWQ